jgi:hypothetical protein
LRASDTHESKGFDELTTKGSSTDHEEVDFSKLLLQVLSVNFNLVIVSAVERGSVNTLFSWQSLVDVKVKPLLHWGILTGELDNFLSNDSSEESCHWRDGTVGVHDSLFEAVIFDIEVQVAFIFTFVGFHEAFC